MKPHCSIIAINWNSARDTIEFVASLWSQNYENFSLILLDNDSTDDSLSKIKAWMKAPGRIPSGFELGKALPERIPFVEMEWQETDSFVLSENEPLRQVFLLKNERNLGFAKAVNRGLEFARKQFGSPYYFLLNNDIFIDASALEKIIAAAETNPEFDVLQSAIYYYDAPERIWNAGGRILPWGQTRYFRKMPQRKIYRTYSISGCALLLRKQTIDTLGLLDERFFHGEEDLEYALRLKKNGRKCAVVADSRIYHKVSVGANKQWARKSGRLINAALNRFLNMKTYFPAWFWKIWRVITLFYYFLLLLILYRESLRDSWKIIRLIYHYSGRISAVTPQLLQEIRDKLK